MKNKTNLSFFSALGLMLSFIFLTSPVFSQPTVDQPADQVVGNGDPTAPVTFTGSVPGTVFSWVNDDPTIGLGANGFGNIASFNAINAGVSPKIATITVTPSLNAGYAHSDIPFSPLSTAGTSVSLSDDAVSGALPLGFSFIFYGNTYTQFYISSNGFITFSANQSSGCCVGQLIPNGFTPNNLIAAVWTDLYPPGGGPITYYTTGTAPNRKTVISYVNVPYCCNNTSTVSTQIILNENGNTIEIHTAYVINGAGGGFNRTQGVENLDGTVATATPGRNRQNWVATNSGDMFTPQVAITGTPKSFTITVNPDVSYVAQIMGGDSYNTLQEAIDAASDGNTIILLQNIAETNLAINNSVILNAGSFTLTASGLTIPSGKYMKWEPGMLTIPTGSSINNMGTLWNNGTIIHTDTYTNAGTYKGTGTFNGNFINNGTVTPGD